MEKTSRWYRFLEMLPGLLAWNLILFPVWGAFLVPRAVAYFVLAFLVFWIYQSFKSAILGIRGYFKIRQAEATNWKAKYQKEYQSNWLPWEKIRHLVIIPNYSESVQKLATTLERLAAQKEINPRRQLIVVLAMEARAKDARQRAFTLLRRFRGRFWRLLATFHPPNLPGEIKGKASNEAWAARQAKELLIKQESLPGEYLTVTSCDADALLHPKYFAALTYYFASDPARYLRFWQSPIFWYNNLERVPAPIRIVGILSNIIHVANLQEPDQLYFNYSTYSLSFKLLDEVGYWDPDVIPEDWHIFLQAFFAKRGKTTVRPIFLPTTIDAPEGRTYWEALKNRYLQCQRHAWGATDIPYAIVQAWRHPEIPLLARVLRIYKLIETHLIWSTNWFILTLGASLPVLLNPRFFQTTLGYNLPRISRWILTICLLALAVIIALDWQLQPKRNQLSWNKKVLYLIQWILMPVATLFLSVLPGLDAQTRLVLGKRLEYRPTKKF